MRGRRRTAWAAGLMVALGLPAGTARAADPVALPAVTAASDIAAAQGGSVVLDRDGTALVLAGNSACDPSCGPRLARIDLDTPYQTKGPWLPLPGDYAGQVAVDSADGTIYAVTNDAQSPAGGNPGGHLTIIRDGAVAKTLTLPNNSGSLTVDPSTHTAYLLGFPCCSGYTPSPLYTVHDDTLSGGAPLPFPAAGIAVDAASHDVQAIAATRSGRFGGGYPFAVTVRDGAVVSTIDDPPDVAGRAIAVDAATHTTYIAGSGLTPSQPDAIYAYRDGARVGTVPVRASSLAVDGSGTLYAVDEATRIVRTIRDGAVVGTVDAGLAHPSAIAAGPSGVLLGGRQGIRRIAPTTAPGIALVAPVPSAHDCCSDEPVEKDAPIYVAFNRPMDTLATGNAFHVTDADGVDVEGSVVWWGTQLAVFVPRNGLPSRRTLTARVEWSARSAEGEYLAEPLAFGGTWTFTVRPTTVVARSGEDGTLRPDGVIYFVFSDPVDKASVERTFRLSAALADNETPGPDALPGRFGWIGDRVMIFKPDATLTLGKVYVASSAGRELAGGPIDGAGSTFIVTKLPTPQ